MSKIKLTLKLRVMIITIMMIVITGVVLLTAINYDITKNMSKLNDTINSGIANGNINSQQLINEEVEGVKEVGDEANGELLESDDDIETSELVQVALNDTRSNIYITSILSFIIIVCAGAIGSYFMANRALDPIIELNEDIKKIDADNLEQNLNFDGPYDEIRDLKISFNKMLAKLNNAFDSQKRFNSNVAHELKTPLAVIKTNIDVLNSIEDKSVEEYAETLEIVEKSVVKMNIMIETLLDMIRQENAPLEDEVFIDNIITDISDDLYIIANKRNINIKTNIKKVNKIIGNEILLYRALYNVVDNSIKYNKENGEIIISCENENNEIVITVSDTGIGISEESISKIFSPFYRGGGNNISKITGVGLGLALTKSVVEIHGGEILVNSILGAGSSFVIKLPK